MSKVGSVDREMSGLRGLTSMWSNFAARAESSIDRAPARAFIVLSFVYFVVVFSASSLKLMWLDELITWHIARLPDVAAIWHALERGADPNPPVTHILVHFCRKIFGDHEFAYRLPAMVGYWVGLLSLFLFLQRRLPPVWAIAGTVLSMTMAAFEYSYESRSYGIFYGLAMLAVLCWSRSFDEARPPISRWLALAGMFFALAAGISTNYFAVLAFLPIAGGEAVRTLLSAREDLRQRRGTAAIIAAIDLRIWIALGVSATPLIAYRPLIAHSIAQFAPYAWNKVSMQQVSDSYTQMVEVMLYPLLWLFGLAVVLFLVGRFLPFVFCSGCRARVLPRWFESILPRDEWGVPFLPHELAAVVLLMAYPLLGYIIASIRGGMLSPRFVIPVCFGFAIAGTVVAFRLFGKIRTAGVVMLIFVSAWFLCRESVVCYWYEEQKQCFYKVLDHLPEADAEVQPGVPIAIPDPLLALTFQHYAPPQIARRIVFPVDFPAIRFYRRDDSPEENLWAGRNSLYTLHIMPLARFQNSVGEYLIIAGDGNWMLEDLGHHRYPLDRLPINTRAGAIGGFTPLARGIPAFYIAKGEGALQYTAPLGALPVSFHTQDNLPQTTEFNPDGVQE